LHALNHVEVNKPANGVLKGVETVRKQEVNARIKEVGIIPAVRMSSAEDACFAAETINRAGIPIVEITVTVPGFMEVISDLKRRIPEMIVGAGTVLDPTTAQRCLDAGAQFLTSPGFILEVVEFAIKNEIAVFPGALTPTEVIVAWRAGADLIKVFPCAQLGGDSYIRALRGPLPHVPLIASGGVNQSTALNFVLAGTVALGVGEELIPTDAVKGRREDRILELARRFKAIVREGRGRKSAR
jgi:2-dehydro-3-deoxyphosphogluconate aldolase/(4S)-4-hydroxy-2-oxoglutarate aldolase